MMLLVYEPQFSYLPSSNNHGAVRKEFGGLNEIMQVECFTIVLSKATMKIKQKANKQDKRTPHLLPPPKKACSLGLAGYVTEMLLLCSREWDTSLCMLIFLGECIRLFPLGEKHVDPVPQ